MHPAPVTIAVVTILGLNLLAGETGMGILGLIVGTGTIGLLLWAKRRERREQKNLVARKGDQ